MRGHRDPVAGDVIGGKFELVRRLGVGGMGTVWEAKADVGHVALKLLHAFSDPKLVARLQREWLTVERLQSPHIVDTLGYGTHDDGTPFMVLELLDGEDLGARLKRERRLQWNAVLPIAEQIASALTAAHELGVVHRDLKPPNIFLCKAPQDGSELVKLLDFGIAHCEDETFTGLTTAGRALGSPHYMSPEQASGRHVDARADLWSFGVLLYRALTGKRPFDGPEMATVMVLIAKHAAPKASTIVDGLPAGIDEFFTRALKKDAADRFQSARDMMDAFRALTREPELVPTPASASDTVVESPPVPEPVAPPPRPAREQRTTDESVWKARAQWLVIAGLIALCVGGVAYSRRAELGALMRQWFGDEEVYTADPPKQVQPVTAIPAIPPMTLKGPREDVTLPLSRPFILNIWLQRCPDCMPSFEIWKNMAANGRVPDVPVVNLAYVEVDPAWAESYRVDEKLVVDASGTALVRPLVVYAFTTFVVAPDGRILFRSQPKERDFEIRLQAAVQKARSPGK